MHIVFYAQVFAARIRLFRIAALAYSTGKIFFFGAKGNAVVCLLGTALYVAVFLFYKGAYGDGVRRLVCVLRRKAGRQGVSVKPAGVVSAVDEPPQRLSRGGARACRPL